MSIIYSLNRIQNADKATDLSLLLFAQLGLPWHKSHLFNPCYGSEPGMLVQNGTDSMAGGSFWNWNHCWFSSETENKAPSQCRAPASPVRLLPLGDIGSHLSQRDMGAERDQGAQCRGCPPKPDCFLSGASGRNRALPPWAQCLGYLKQRALRLWFVKIITFIT